jgi:hypothetical protein
MMKRSRRGLLLPAAAGLFFAAAVSAFAAGDREDCAASADNPDQKIASCTRAIAVLARSEGAPFKSDSATSRSQP